MVYNISEEVSLFLLDLKNQNICFSIFVALTCLLVIAANLRVTYLILRSTTRRRMSPNKYLLSLCASGENFADGKNNH